MGDVTDVIFLVVVLAFFAVALAVVAACDRIASGDRTEHEPDTTPEGTP